VTPSFNHAPYKVNRSLFHASLCNSLQTTDVLYGSKCSSFVTFHADETDIAIDDCGDFANPA
jgi:hypothetical protein